MYFADKWYYVYIMTNRSKTLYTGITSKLRERVFQHKTGVFKGFTSKYKLDRLVYWERFKSVYKAIGREKQLKGWRRIKKIQLIVGMNPTWADLAADWYPASVHRSFDSPSLTLGLAQDDKTSTEHQPCGLHLLPKKEPRGR